MKLSEFNVYHTETPCFVANTLTGACIEMSVENIADIMNCSIEKFSEEEILALQDMGIFIDDAIDEKCLLRYAYNTCKYDNTIAKITIAPSLECNFACVYCYEKRNDYYMSQEIQDSCIKYIECLIKENGIKELKICWYGGEPLLHINIIEYLSKQLIVLCECCQVIYTASIITNGYLINDSIIKILQTCKVYMAQITIDGLDDTHNQRRVLVNGKQTYKKICEGISLLNNSKIKVALRVNLDKSNIGEYEMVKKRFANFDNVFCYPAIVTEEETESICQKSLCYKHNEFAVFYEKLDINNDYEEYMPGIYSCFAEHEYSCLISPEGYLYKCLNDICNPKYAIGHVQKNVDGILAASKYMGRDPISEKECSECVYFPMCYGGCVYEYMKHKSHACSAVRFMYIKQCIKRIGEDCHENYYGEEK